jgi:23S rRNA (adenine2503-C2)-methyltransferase
VAIPNGNKDLQVEFVESVQPPFPREKKWVLIVSSLYGCPVGCLMCDAGGHYKGKVSKEDILKQIDFLVTSRYPDRRLPQEKFKIQFARMGEPALNDAVLDVLQELPRTYDAPGLIPSVSTVAPKNSEVFFERLKKIKDEHYSGGRFQLQFSIHSTNESERSEIIPIDKWSLEKISAFGQQWYEPGDRKISLNFALAKDSELDAHVIKSIFSPEHFLIKLTPINPTHRAAENELSTAIDPDDPATGQAVVTALESQGFEVILSIGEVEENKIGSNCGMYLAK